MIRKLHVSEAVSIVCSFQAAQPLNISSMPTKEPLNADADADADADAERRTSKLPCLALTRQHQQQCNIQATRHHQLTSAQ